MQRYGIAGRLVFLIPRPGYRVSGPARLWREDYPLLPLKYDQPHTQLPILLHHNPSRGLVTCGDPPRGQTFLDSRGRQRIQTRGCGKGGGKYVCNASALRYALNPCAGERLLHEVFVKPQSIADDVGFTVSLGKRFESTEAVKRRPAQVQGDSDFLSRIHLEQHQGPVPPRVEPLPMHQPANAPSAVCRNCPVISSE